ncbi:hypothetical protein BDC45DRAFT_287843 [Circinella umbellata]|nr:hypothetical protein BDC45DRAFT_287843 [Circinella umbellata]
MSTLNSSYKHCLSLIKSAKKTPEPIKYYVKTLEFNINNDEEEKKSQPPQQQQPIKITAKPDSQVIMNNYGTVQNRSTAPLSLSSKRSLLSGIEPLTTKKPKKDYVIAAIIAGEEVQDEDEEDKDEKEEEEDSESNSNDNEEGGEQEANTNNQEFKIF